MKDKRTDDLIGLARSSNNITDDLARSSNKNKGTDDLANSCKKNKKTCDGGENTTDPLISDILNKDPFSDLDSKGYPRLYKDVPDCAAGRSEENRARRRQARCHTQQDEQQATGQLNREALTEENGQRVGCRSQSD